MKSVRSISLFVIVLTVMAWPAAAADFNGSLFADLLRDVLTNMTAPAVGKTDGVVEIVALTSVDSAFVDTLKAKLQPLKLKTHTSDFREAAGSYEEYFVRRLANAGRVVCIVAVDLPPELAHTVAEVARQRRILTASPRSADVSPLSLGMDERSGVFYYSSYELGKEHVTFRPESWPGSNREPTRVPPVWTTRADRIEAVKAFQKAVGVIEKEKTKDEDVRDAVRKIERLLPINENEEHLSGESWPKGIDYLPHYALAYAFARLQNCDAATYEMQKSKIRDLDVVRYERLRAEFSRHSCQLTAAVPVSVQQQLASAQ